MTADAIEAEKLSRRFGQLEAVKGIDLHVRAGEIFGFLGPNGAGKSTTISMLCTLLRPTSGRARVAGFDVGSEPDRVRSRIGLVFQDPSLDSQLSGRENLQLHAYIYDMPAALQKQRIPQVLEMVELTERAGSLVQTYSGGMRRRLEIARGILHHPQVLFLDEPTLGLDPQTRRHIWTYLNDLRRREGLTIFMTTHYMDEAEFCDRIAVIDHGTIVALGTPDELKSTVGGDVITITTEDNERAREELVTRFGLQPQGRDGELWFEAQDGQALVPQLSRDLNVRVNTVAVRRPSLDDVFMKLTGRAIRDEEASQMDQMRGAMRVWQRRR